MSTQQAVTFIGIGAIGLPMAKQLALNGHAVTGVDPAVSQHERAREAGIAAATSITDAAPAGTVVVMVATPDQLNQLVTTALETTDVSAQTWVIMSTVGPDSLRDEAARLQAEGAIVVDAPVTGGVARAITGELTIFASGAPHALDKVTALLSHFGTVRRVGSSLGDGQAIKVVNQHLCSVHIVAAAEALNLAETLGLNKADVLDLISSGAAGSWMLSDRGPRMLAGTNVEVTSTISIFVKDSTLVADAARKAGAQTPLLDTAKERYEQAARMGLATRDDSRVIETYS
ncbi:NAD(P)-dependent oxidoreductase [Pseudarthrobacter niigatensis]|uniref:3-hydroxyisobutyrate dehydrogenase/putative dehydrogenase n=1 Tax=Pseudarthrobacter niigatensis TaxID=369935 RepID=A0AAJ1SPI2_9MICC|nr:NAD(P)-dependent oxidoreductase [Pseudarthrobacter niigatensis]MDQ0144650.1 3-hydroxyisobutyrate dehydrogenase/putative dehydrogenase [Pseudarthrobacter niigatensis]MDQ0265296.1 3-hydroxyisobutyrate dehydrogenase/putative dehydrogenase [Pseudarthrobacter niigatensis]